MRVEVNLEHFNIDQLEQLQQLLEETIDYTLEDNANELNFEAIECIGAELTNR